MGLLLVRLLSMLVGRLPSTSPLAFIKLTSSLFNPRPDVAARTAIKDIQRAKQLCLDNEIDLLLSIGGGSPIDSTKAISHFVREATGSQGWLPHIAVPTTLSVAETTQ